MMAHATLLPALDGGKLREALARPVWRCDVCAFHAIWRRLELSSEHSVELCEKPAFDGVRRRRLCKVHDSWTLRHRWWKHRCRRQWSDATDGSAILGQSHRLRLERSLHLLREEWTQPSGQRTWITSFAIPRAHAYTLARKCARDLCSTHAASDARNGRADEDANAFALCQLTLVHVNRRIR
jgi:hypothetical protein